MAVAPRISFSQDDGVPIVSLQWFGQGEREGEGCAIVFAVGDDHGTFSYSDETHGYAENGIDFKFSDGLPEHAEMMLWQIITDK